MWLNSDVWFQELYDDKSLLEVNVLVDGDTTLHCSFVYKGEDFENIDSGEAVVYRRLPNERYKLSGQYSWNLGLFRTREFKEASEKLALEIIAEIDQETN